jgi:hypothetical protein
MFAEAAPLRLARMRARFLALGALIRSITLAEEGAALEAYGHWLAMMGAKGLDLSEYGSPRLKTHEPFTPDYMVLAGPVSNGNGSRVGGEV